MEQLISSNNKSFISLEVENEVKRRISLFRSWLCRRLPISDVEDNHALCILILSALDNDGMPVFKPVNEKLQGNMDSRISNAADIVCDDDDDDDDDDMPTL